MNTNINFEIKNKIICTICKLRRPIHVNIDLDYLW